jgi:DNA topoisomerase I
MSKKNLVIVESPAKSKTISKFLGKDYEITASYGHVRDLPAKKLGVDVKNNFEPTYTNLKDKSKVLTAIKTLAKKSETVYIATDPDREGEAIAWHIFHATKLPASKVKRIVFNEITENAIKAAIEESREIDIQLVDAQQARRVLDRLIGYKLSPVLSRKIRKGLSAGRVQSVAVKIICDREKLILAFVPEEYWNIDVLLNKKDQKHKFKARLFAKDTDKNKILPTSEAESKQIVSELEKANYSIHSIKKSQAKRNPALPFITSTLQQEASRKLGWSAKKIMIVAQQLYEGIDLGNDTVGLITYMRTDSTRLSDEAKLAAKDFILNKYGDKYYNAQAAVSKKKGKGNVQDAHEAIRPSYLAHAPDVIKDRLSVDHIKLYRLIWDRFLASQMTPCLSDRTAVLIKCESKETYFLKATGSIITFDGFTKVYSEGKDDDPTSLDSDEAILPPLEKTDLIEKNSIENEQKFTKPPARYTEASLVKTMEEKGIGRPSTYAPTLSTIVDRGYIEKENKSLSPTELGQLVNEKLETYFETIVDINFTVDMEKKLDEIMEGKHLWQEVISDFYSPFSEKVDYAYKNMEKINTDKPSDEICEKCDSPMVIKVGRYGEFLACTKFPECKNTKAIIKSLGVNCPDCNSEITEKRSKRGKIFYGCSGYPNCKYATWDEPKNEPCPTCKHPFQLIKKGKGKDEKTYCPKCT